MEAGIMRPAFRMNSPSGVNSPVGSGSSYAGCCLSRLQDFGTACGGDPSTPNLSFRASSENPKLGDAVRVEFFSLCRQRTPWRGKEVNDVATVVLRPNESQDSLLKRFRKKVTRSGILSTVRRKRWFVSKSELRRIQKKKSIRRLKRRERKARSRD
jgi:small subunit ribosomal protein S21